MLWVLLAHAAVKWHPVAQDRDIRSSVDDRCSGPSSRWPRWREALVKLFRPRLSCTGTDSEASACASYQGFGAAEVGGSPKLPAPAVPGRSAGRRGRTRQTEHRRSAPNPSEACCQGRTEALAEPFGPHGLRAGFVTTAYRNGVPDEEIMGHTRHRSLTAMRATFGGPKLGQEESGAAELGL